MKKIIYYCDICKKEIKNAEMEPCNKVFIAEMSSWEDIATKRKVYKDVQICNDCVKIIVTHIDDMVVTNENLKKTICMDLIM